MARKPRRRWGRVRRLPSGRWQARYPGPDGIDRPADQTFDTEKEADIWLVIKEAEVRQGAWFDPDAGRIPLEEYATQWITERLGLAPKSVQRYEGLLRLHIAPYLGHFDVVNVTYARVRTWRRTLLDAGVGASTVAKAYRFLKTVMNTAVDEDPPLIRRNPCRIKGAGSERPPEREAPTMEQVFALADVIGARWRTLVLLAAFAALRFGEVAALRRHRLDLEAMTAQIVVAVVELSGQLIEGPPKSRAGRRVVALPAILKPELENHLDQWSESEPEGRVFIGARGGPLRESTFRQRVWVPATVEVGLSGLHIHDLRHAGACWAAAAGATIKELMDLLGHASPNAAMVYQHVVADRRRHVADAVSAQAEALQRARSGHGDQETTSAA